MCAHTKLYPQPIKFHGSLFIIFKSACEFPGLKHTNVIVLLQSLQCLLEETSHYNTHVMVDAGSPLSSLLILLVPVVYTHLL